MAIELLPDLDRRTHLTVADVIAIRADPRSLRVIARDYGVTNHAIDCIKKRKTWKRVPADKRHGD